VFSGPLLVQTQICAKKRKSTDAPNELVMFTANRRQPAQGTQNTAGTMKYALFTRRWKYSDAFTPRRVPPIPPTIVAAPTIKPAESIEAEV
jgi:hypothetical protein